VETNDALAQSPELVNTDPYGAGWMLKMTIADESELAGLLDAAAYEASVTAG
jgi:glycine cleavage system H protein